MAKSLVTKYSSVLISRHQNQTCKIKVTIIDCFSLVLLECQVGTEIYYLTSQLLCKVITS